ncbi:hypothetical protein Neosp_014357 [[Neocosmospora] mangrovei]
MLEDVDLFGRPVGKDGQYDAHVHLAEMVSLLGPPPEQVIEAEQYFQKAYLMGTITNPQDRACATMNEYWGGPFFDENGQEEDDFVDFAGNMLQWIPEDRMTAKELQRPPFLKTVDEYFEKDQKQDPGVPGCQ